jgi:hypothetical protein
MKMIKIVFFSFFLFSPLTIAGPITSLNFYLLGYEDLSVNGTNYDVEFFSQSYIDLYINGPYTVPFTTQAEALTAVETLLTDVYANTVYDQNPIRTAGCNYPAFCSIYTAYGAPELVSGILNTSTVRLRNSTGLGANAFGGIGSLPIDRNLLQVNAAVYAVWSPSSNNGPGNGNNENNNGGGSGGPASVAEPATSALMLIGMGLLLLSRRTLTKAKC